MKRSFRLFSVFGLAALALGTACDDGSDGGGPAATPPPVANPPPGTPPGTTPPTNPPPDQGTGVTVTVIRGHGPVAGARVVFQDESGAVQGQPFVTDATGVVTQPTAPKQLTVIIGGIPGRPMDVEYVTYVGVEEGDRLVVDTASSGYDPAQNDLTPISYDVMLPSDRAGATFYGAGVDRGCSDPIGSVDGTRLRVSSACLRQTNAILGAAWDDEGVTPLAFAWKKGVAPPAADDTPVELEPWADPAALAVTIANPPAQFDENLYGWAASIVGVQTFVHDAVEQPSPGAWNFMMPPSGFADGYQAAFTEDWSSDETYGARAVAQRAAVGPTIALDYAALMPKITASTFDTSDANRPLIGWTTERPLTGADAADFGLVQFEWRTLVDGDTVAGRTWTIVVPANATSVKAPQLPDDEAENAPGNPNTEFLVLRGIIFGESSLAPGYKEAKRVPVQTDYWRFGDIGSALPAVGTLRATSLGAWLGMTPPG